MVQNVFSSLVWGDTCVSGLNMCFFWDTRGKTKDSESSFVASAQYLEHSSSHHEQQHDDVAAVAGGGVGGGGGQDHHHQSYQPQHHHCVSLRVTH